MRAGVLLVMAGVTAWKIRRSAALVLLFEAVVVGVLAVIAFAR